MQRDRAGRVLEPSRSRPRAPAAAPDPLAVVQAAGNAAAARVAGRRQAAPGPVLARLKFARWQGLSALAFWASYSAKESELIELERQASEALSNLERYRQTEQTKHLRTDLDKINAAKLADTHHVEVKRHLVRIRDTALEEADSRFFDSNQGTALQAGPATSLMFSTDQETGKVLSAETTLHDAVVYAQVMAMQGDTGQAGELRELLDALGQWISDALLKLSAGGGSDKLVAAVTREKAAVLQAGAHAHAAFLARYVANDAARARQHYKLAGDLLSAMQYATLEDLAGRTLGAAKPKLREAQSAMGYDGGAILLAAAVAHDGFIPHVIAGLPTGGVHAAGRVAAAFALMGGPMPKVWATRPQGVKVESKQFMQGAGRDDIMTPSEVGHLKAARATRILVVDDGFVSGDTLLIAKRRYEEELVGADVRTAVLSVNDAQSGATVQIEDKDAPKTETGPPTMKTIDNPANYVATAGGIAGRVGEIARADRSDEAKSLRGRVRPEEDVLLVSSIGTLKKLKLADVVKR